MKKLQTLILCTVVWLAWVVLVNAKELTSVKTNVSSDKITDAYAQLNTDDQKWITEVVENADSTCIIDLNYKPREYTEQLIDNCLLTDNRDPKVCDKNRDWEVSISDITYFIDLCVLRTSNAENLKTYSQKSENNKNINKKNPTSNLKEMANWYMYKTWMNSLTWIIKTWDESDAWNTNCEDYTQLLIDNCLLTNNRETEKCDIDGDWKARISDVTEFIDECLMQTNAGTNDNGNGTNSDNWSNNNGNGTDSDNWSNNNGLILPKDLISNGLEETIKFAHNYWLISANTIEEANPEWKVSRAAFAKITSKYATNILWLKPDTSKNCSFPDVTTGMDKSFDYWITKACQLWLMWIGTNNFNPKNPATEWQVYTVVSRMISLTEDKNYYESYIEYLCKNNFIKCNWSSKVLMKRQDVLRMLEALNNNQLQK